MGAQQILLIALSVIIVGVAVSVGYQMFDVQDRNLQRKAIAADLQRIGAHVLAYFRTHVSIAGGQSVDVNLANLADYLGFKYDNGEYVYKNYNGIYTISVINANADEAVISIQGIDKETDRRVDLTATITQATHNVLVQKTP